MKTFRKTMHPATITAAIFVISAPEPLKADVIYSDAWSEVSSVGGYAVSGGFLFDSTNQTLLSDNTAIEGICAAGTCGLTLLPPEIGLHPPSFYGLQFQYTNPFNYPNPSHITLFTLSSVYTSNFDIPGVNVPAKTWYGIENTGIHPDCCYINGMALNQTLVSIPSPTPSTGVPSLIALGCVALFFRRDWLRQALRC